MLTAIIRGLRRGRELRRAREENPYVWPPLAGQQLEEAFGRALEADRERARQRLEERA